MARKKAAPKQAATKPDPKDESATPITSIHGMDASDIVGLVDGYASESEGHWDKKYKLKAATKENEELYLGEQVSKNDDGDDRNLSLDNRIFSSVRTIVPYVTSRVTEPECYPSSRTEEAKKFAEDFEKALHIKAKTEKVKTKLKFALEDALIRRRGYLKPRYDAVTKNFCKVEWVPAESVLVDHKAKAYEEPRFMRHYLEKTVEDLILMFPDQEEAIKRLFKIDKNASQDKYRESHKINEDWVFIADTDNGELDLVVCWNCQGQAFGVVQDPNWRYGKENFFESHLMPFIFVNVLSDGRSRIDRTSYVEQSKYLQKTVDLRGKQINKAAGIGSTGMPVVDSAALGDDQAEALSFDEDTVLELDVNKAAGDNINSVFTTWKAQPLSSDVYTDKNNAMASIDNTWGTPNVFRGEQSDNNTLGQDTLLRDQAFGRQQEILDAIDDAMERLYLFIAQCMLVYGDEQEEFRIVGENAEFDYVMMHTDELDTKAVIQVKTGTSMPIDNAQRRATADKAASQKMIDPLSYWEIMDQPNAQKYAKRLSDFMLNPGGFMQDTEEEVFDRDAFTDIQLLLHGKDPEYRSELKKEYFDHLNHYILSGDLENPNIPMPLRQKIASFINVQLARGQKMLGMAETQLPTAQDVNNFNAQADTANGAPQPQAQVPSPQGAPAPAPAGPPAPITSTQ